MAATIKEVATLPTVRTPVYDGASGLHYSGRLYMNQFEKLSNDMCKGVSATEAQIDEVMPDSISRPDLPIDSTTMRITSSSLQSYIAGLNVSNRIPGQLPTIPEQIAADKAFYERIRSEYCYYDARYRSAINKLLTVVSAPGGVDQSQVNQVVNSAKGLNMRLNSLLEMMNYVGNMRAQNLQKRNADIETTNTELQKKVAVLNSQRQFLTSSNIRTQTQDEMIRYSAEKNRSMNVQILLFVALNVVALGTVLTVYKSMGSGPGA